LFSVSNAISYILFQLKHEYIDDFIEKENYKLFVGTAVPSCRVFGLNVKKSEKRAIVFFGY
jgi:hypothetical protein